MKWCDNVNSVSGLIRDQIIRHVVVLITFPLFIAAIYFYSLVMSSVVV